MHLSTQFADAPETRSEPSNGGEARPAPWRRAVAIAIGAVAVGWCALRFIGLERVPAGLSTDETLAGLHVACLAQTGQTADGHPWPLFATGIGGGLYTPAYLYTLYAWTRVFGLSITSLRGLSATFSILAILGVGALARRLAGRRAAAFAMTAAALSPWSFQVARIADDGPMAPMLVVWGVYLFLRSPRWPWAAAGGLVLTLAAYTYPPVRLTVALLTPLLLAVEWRRLDRRRLAAFFGTTLVVGLPLAIRILDGSLMGRASSLSIFSLDYIEAHRRPFGVVSFVVRQALDNLFEHLRPSYLFFTGDPNIRHSTQIMGELGWVDILALAGFVVALGTIVARAFRPSPNAAAPSRRWLVAGATVLAGGFCVLPAALCWEGLPHALRSMAAWPAVAIFTGVVLAEIDERARWMPAAVLALAVAQTVHFVPYFFRTYPEASASAWGAGLREAAEAHDERRFVAEAKGLPELGVRYYLVRDFGETCLTSQPRAQKILEGR